MRLALIDLEDDTFPRETIGAAPSWKWARTGDLDQIFLGVRTVKDLSRLGTLSKRLETVRGDLGDRAKGAAATVSDPESMAAGKQAGLVDVKVVSFSDTHTAEVRHSGGETGTIWPFRVSFSSNARIGAFAGRIDGSVATSNCDPCRDSAPCPIRTPPASERHDAGGDLHTRVPDGVRARTMR